MGSGNLFDDVNLPAQTPTEYRTPQHTQLTPLRAHYLKRELVGGQLAVELNALGDPNALSKIGWPFDPRPPVAGDNDDSDLPFLRFFFHHFVMTFPFLAEVDSNVFYSKKLQPFIESFMARNISVNDEREEETGIQTKRHKLAGKAEKHVGLLISSAVKLADNEGREEVVRIVDVKSAVPPSALGATNAASPQQALFQVNVVGVRAVTERARLGRKVKHEHFVVRTSRANQPDVFVSRRYGDFVALSEMVRMYRRASAIADFPSAPHRIPGLRDTPTSSERQARNRDRHRTLAYHSCLIDIGSYARFRHYLNLGLIDTRRSFQGTQSPHSPGPSAAAHVEPRHCQFRYHAELSAARADCTVAGRNRRCQSARRDGQDA